MYILSYLFVYLNIRFIQIINNVIIQTMKLCGAHLKIKILCNLHSLILWAPNLYRVSQKAIEIILV